MAFRLYIHRGDDGLFEIVVGKLLIPQDCAQIDGVFITEAEQQPTLHGNPDPVAVGTEIMRHRGNEAYATVFTFDLNIARRACRLRGHVCELVCRGDNAPDPVIATGCLLYTSDAADE